MRVIGTSQKDEALECLPKGTQCYSASFGGYNRFVVVLPNGLRVARERSSLKVWAKAKEWVLKPDNIEYLNKSCHAKKKIYSKK